jgi:hypothetical protein
VRGRISVVSIVDKMSENRLRWFGHVMRPKQTNAVRVMQMKVEGKKERKKPRKRLLDTIVNNMRATGVCIDVKIQDEWRFRTKETDPK